MRKKYKYSALILATLLLISSFSASFVQVAFKVNKDFIIKELCVNRFKPQMHCDGKCYLKKQMKQQQEKSTSGSKDQSHSETLSWLFTGDVVMRMDEQPQQPNPVSHFAEILSIGFILSIDRPPPVCA